MRRPDPRNVGVRNGEWGEDVAVEHLRRRGFEIVDRNSRPVSHDRRLEIDIVAWDPSGDAMVFVEVKQHAAPSPGQRRLRSIGREKLARLRRACGAWRRANGWKGSFRFDAIEVYGVPGGGRPVIDHIEGVRLFVPPERYVRWC